MHIKPFSLSNPKNLRVFEFILVLSVAYFDFLSLFFMQRQIFEPIITASGFVIMMIPSIF